MLLVTGGCGFIGSNFVLDWFKWERDPIVVVDKLTYAGNFSSLDSVKGNPLFNFIKGDINDKHLIESIIEKFKPKAIINFAAETHVDRSINNPEEFVKTNINGTFCLLESAKNYWNGLNSKDQNIFRYLQVSTDEVFGSLTANALPFTETTPYSPNNPYSASKAAADHLVKAYHHTYGFPVLITNCSNNYGPFQFPEKLIPFCILNALQGKPLLIYGDGMHVRDWLYVTDHCLAIRMVLAKANIGETYNIGGHSEKTNIEVVETICKILDELIPTRNSYSSLIRYIDDRQGHDRRYAIDSTKIHRDLAWAPQETFETGLRNTILWYLENASINIIKQNESFRE